MLRVLHLIKALGRGGAEVLLAEGLTVADRQRFEYRYGYLQTRPCEVADDLHALGASVDCFHINGVIGMFQGASRIARYLRDNNIDLVHAHLPMSGVIGRIAGKLSGVPVVYTEHCPIESYHPIVRSLDLITWRWQAHAIAISDDVARSIHAHVGDIIPVRTVWNGVNTERFSPGCGNRMIIRSQLGIPEKAPVIGTVAVFRDTPQKRLDIWLEAARLIWEVEPRSHFLLVGDGTLRAKLEEKAQSLGISGVTHFVGRQRDVRPYLATMDIFLMSSAYEGFGLAPVEAMAMEVPVVATDVEGVRNIISSGETGLLAPFDQHVASNLARHVVTLIRSPEYGSRIATAGRRTAIERFSIERMQRELEDIYERVLSDSKKRPAYASLNRPGFAGDSNL